MTKRKKNIIAVIAIALILLAIVFFASRKNKSTSNYVTEKAAIEDLKQTVSVTGELKSESELSLNFETTGRVNWTGVVGRKVAAGEVIGKIDQLELDKKVEIARLALEKAQADVGVNDDKIEEADQNVSNAKKYLDEVTDLEDQKVDAADQAYEDAADYYDTALDYYNQIVSEQGTADNSTSLYAKLTLDTALKNKNAAEDAKDTARKTRDANVQSAENSYKLAKDQRTTVESDFAKAVENTVVETARANYEIALNNLEKAALKSPVNGTITQLNYKAGEVLGTSTLTTPFAKVLSYDFLIESNVPESDIAEVKLGQKAEITFDALSESDKFQATVVEIEPASTVIQDVVYYKVKLKMDSLDQRFKTGMSCDIDIKIGEKKGALSIPQRAVKENDNGKETVSILSSDSSVIEVEVKTGLKDDEGLVEIISGLKKGDNVVVAEKE